MCVVVLVYTWRLCLFVCVWCECKCACFICVCMCACFICGCVCLCVCGVLVCVICVYVRVCVRGNVFVCVPWCNIDELLDCITTRRGELLQKKKLSRCSSRRGPLVPCDSHTSRATELYVFNI